MNNIQKFLILFVLIINFYLLIIIYRYWQADIYYNNAKTFNKNNKQDQAIVAANKAISISPGESIYVSELALADYKVETAIKALNLSSYNQNIRRVLVSNLVKSSGTNPDYLLITEKILKDGIVISPNDPSLYYKLGILQLKINKTDDAIASLEKAAQLKPNYKDSRYALGMTYKALKENEKAKEEFEYLLKYIDPNDELTKKYLGELYQPQK